MYGEAPLAVPDPNYRTSMLSPEHAEWNRQEAARRYPYDPHKTIAFAKANGVDVRACFGLKPTRK